MPTAGAPSPPIACANKMIQGLSFGLQETFSAFPVEMYWLSYEMMLGEVCIQQVT